jgi:CHAT domain-containing protein
VHAAGIYDASQPDYCAEYVVSSYTPTLSALLRAQNGVKTFSTARSKLLLVAADSAEDEKLPTLYHVEDEMWSISDVAEKTGVTLEVQCAGSATKSQVSTSLKSAEIVHLACHGVQHPDEPLKSAFYLEDGTLTVEQLIDHDLKDAFLAFLSACETAKGEKTTPDQTIHLAATMLFAGFKSVVATIW